MRSVKKRNQRFRSHKKGSSRLRAAIEMIESRVLLSAFQPGDLVVYRVGTGSGALSGASTAVYLDEYTPSGTLVQSIPLPTASSGGNNPLTATGTGTSEGLLSLSANGQNLLLTGYDAAPGGNLNPTESISAATDATPAVFTTNNTVGMSNGDAVSVTFSGTGSTYALSPSQTTYYVGSLTATTFSLYTTAALTTPVTGSGTFKSGTFTDNNIAVQREVGVASASGAINTTTTLGTLGNSSIYSAASVDGTSGVYVGSSNGSYYTTIGSTATPTTLSSQGVYGVEINNGQLYVSSTASATVLSTEGSGLPTTAGQTLTELPGVTFSGTSDAGVGYSREFAFATLNPGDTSPDTLYVADDYNDGIDKLSLVNGSWVLNGEIGQYPAGGTPLAGVTGIVAEPVQGGEQLFMSTAGKIYTVTDNTGYDQGGGTLFSAAPPLTLVASAATNEAFRGIEFVPQPAGSPTIATNPVNQTAVVGTSATFSASAYGVNDSVQWEVNTGDGTGFNPIPGATFDTLTVPDVTQSQNGYQYEAVFTNGSGSITSSPATLTVIPGPEFSFSTTSYTAPNTDGSVTITVDRSGDDSATDTVNYATSDGTAKAGTNYTAESGTLTFAAGNDTPQTFTVPLTYVASQTSPLSFNLTLSDVSGSNSANAVIGPPATFTITSPVEKLVLSSSTYNVNDTDGTAVFSVDRTGSYSADAGTVPYTYSGASSGSGTVSFAAGQLVSAGTITLPAPTGSNQTITITLGSGITGFSTGGAILGSTTSATLTDVHAASTNVSSAAASVTDIETTGPYSTGFALVNGDTSAGTGSFAYLAYEVLEFSPSTSPSLYPAPGTTVNASGISSLSLQLYNTDSGTDNYGGHIGNFNVYFLPDSDSTTPTSSLTFSTSAAPTGLSSSQFKSAPVLIGTFSFNNTAGYDTYTPAAIPAAVETALVADLNSGADFRLAVTPQTYGKGAIAVDWDGLSANTPTLSFTAAETVNQTPEYISFQSASYSESEAGPATTITLTRSGPDSDTATVDYSTGGGNAVAGTNYTAATNVPVTFAAGSSTATFTVTPIDQADQGGDKYLYITLSNPSTGSSSNIGVLGSPSTATLTIQDNSTAPTQTLTPSIAGAADVEIDGIYDDTEFKATARGGTGAPYASFGLADFTPTAPSNPVTGIDSATLTATVYGGEAPSAGNVDIYLVSDNTSSIAVQSPESTSNGFYDATQGVEGIGTQFGTKYLLGTYYFNGASIGTTLTIPLNLSGAGEAQLVSALNNPNSNFRIAITPEDTNVVADFQSTSLSLSIVAQEAPAPTVTAISPTSGPASGGTSVIITGTNFSDVTAVDFGSTPASSFTVNNDGSITAVDPAGSGTVDVTVVTPGGTSATSSADQFTYTSTVVTISSVVVNGNNSALAGVQRSMVNSIEYTFSQAVILNQTNAFSIAVHSGQSGTVPTLTWTAVNPDASGGSTQWVVSFSGAGVSGGSIANGVYDITLNAAGVSGESGGTLASSRTDTFYRLFGDAQGTKNVSTADYNAFLSTNGLKSTAPGYLAEFAADGSGKIDTSDYNAFLADLGKKLTGFTPTI